MEKKLTMVANVAIIFVAIIVAITYAKNWRQSQSPNVQSVNSKALIGKQFPIAQSWGTYRKTVVLVLSVGCRYCSASAPFYQRLTAYAASHQVNVVALLPQSKEEGSQYLQQLKLNIPVVGDVDFQQINVIGTPTLFVVDGKGLVQEVWQGQLQDNRQDNVLSILG